MSWQEFGSKKPPIDAVKKDSSGREINPHVPQFIANVPWYLDNGGDKSVHHQASRTAPSQSSDINTWYTRGQTQSSSTSAVKKFRKGSCENCGAISHKTRDCVERPRKLGAKYTHANIAADEVLQSVGSLGFEGKRDRWNGYDPQSHAQVVKDFELVEQMKKELLEKQQVEVNDAVVHEASEIKDENELDALSDSDDDNDNDKDKDDKYADAADVVGQKVDLKSRLTVRNLRIREDTAKYLKDLNAEDYDPKGRSMRKVNQGSTIPAEYDTADQFEKYNSGEIKKVQELEKFSWEAQDRGVPVHLQADPTRTAIVHKEHVKQQSDVLSESRRNILAKYGGDEHLRIPKHHQHNVSTKVVAAETTSVEPEKKLVETQEPEMPLIDQTLVPAKSLKDQHLDRLIADMKRQKELKRSADELL